MTVTGRGGTETDRYCYSPSANSSGVASVDGKHLTRFQGVISVFKFFKGIVFV